MGFSIAFSLLLVLTTSACSLASAAGKLRGNNPGLHHRLTVMEEKHALHLRALDMGMSFQYPTEQTSIAIGLTLVNAETDKDIRPLSSGDVINLLETGSSLNVRADSDLPVEMLKFYFDGIPARTERVYPYALGGTVGLDDYNEYDPIVQVGFHTIKVVVVAGGSTIGQVKFDFEVTGTPPVATEAPVAAASPTRSPTYDPTASLIATDSPTVSSRIFINAGSANEDKTIIRGNKKRSYNSIAPITGSGDVPASVLQSHRYTRKGGRLTYTVPGFAPNSYQTVTLGFAEVYSDNCAVGKRIIDVTVQGMELVRNLDVFAMSGCHAVHQESGTFQADSSGNISITLRATVENPMVSYIDIKKSAPM